MACADFVEPEVSGLTVVNRYDAETEETKE